MFHQHQILIDKITKNDMPISYRMTKRATYNFICDIDRYYDLILDFYKYKPNLDEEDE